jgi:hypothetical protein
MNMPQFIRRGKSSRSTAVGPAPPWLSMMMARGSAYRMKNRGGAADRVQQVTVVSRVVAVVPAGLPRSRRRGHQSPQEKISSVPNKANPAMQK